MARNDAGRADSHGRVLRGPRDASPSCRLLPDLEARPGHGFATINWIAEITVDNASGWTTGDWNRQVGVDDFIHHFAAWNYDWLDVPAMLRGADAIFEYPMIDRDPVPTWVAGNVALLGDAAHVMYPTGSNGASQAVIDARALGATILEHGVTGAALQAYDGLCALRSRRSCYATAGRDRLACSTCWTSAAGECSTTSMSDSRRGVGSVHEPLQGRRGFRHGNTEWRAADRRAGARGCAGISGCCGTTCS